MSRYPSCFPDNFETEILPKGAENKAIAGYSIVNKDKAADKLESSEITDDYIYAA